MLPLYAQALDVFVRQQLEQAVRLSDWEKRRGRLWGLFMFTQQGVHTRGQLPHPEPTDALQRLVLDALAKNAAERVEEVERLVQEQRFFQAHRRAELILGGLPAKHPYRLQVQRMVDEPARAFHLDLQQKAQGAGAQLFHARAAHFLMSPASAYMTGQVLHVDGGLWMGS